MPIQKVKEMSKKSENKEVRGISAMLLSGLMYYVQAAVR